MKIALRKRIVLTVTILIACIMLVRVPLAAGALSGRIAFVSSDPGAGLFIMNADGSSRYKVPLPYEQLPIVGGPQWSPDGEWLTFHGATGHNGQIYIVRPDGTGFRRVTDGSGNLVEPSFSPDGMQITFCGPDGRALYIINTDGTDLRRLPVDGSFPKWSPLGDKILYSNWGRTYESDLFLYDLGTLTSTKITTHLPGQAFYYAAWSPDATKLAVTVRTAGNGDVWIMNSDGSGPRNLTADWSTSYEDWPSWSPDGQYVVFTSDISGNSDIWYMRTDGTNRINITNSPEDEWLPAIGIPLEPTDPPIADAGDDIIASASEEITLDGSNSYDPDGEIIQYTWKRLPDEVVIYSGEDPNCQTRALGRVEEVIELTVTDNYWATATDTVRIVSRTTQDLKDQVAAMQSQIEELQRQIQEFQALVDKIVSWPPIRQWLRRATDVED